MRLADQAGLGKVPEVGFYDSAELNALATGPSKSCALVALSLGLLRSMNKSELEGVLAHEVAHIANGDMVTMTLVQGVVNAIVMFFCPHHGMGDKSASGRPQARLRASRDGAGV
jgi:heat shock protein HtpX